MSHLTDIAARTQRFRDAVRAFTPRSLNRHRQVGEANRRHHEAATTRSLIQNHSRVCRNGRRDCKHCDDCTLSHRRRQHVNTTTTSSAIRSRTRSHSERDSSATCHRSGDHCVLDNLHQRQRQRSNQHNVPAYAARASQTCAYFDQRSLQRTNKSTSSSTAKAASEKASSPRHSSEDPEIVAAFVAPSIATARKKSTIERFNAAASPNRKDIELLRSVFRAARLLSAKSSKPLLPLFPEMQSSRVVFPSPQLRRLHCAFIATSA